MTLTVRQFRLLLLLTWGLLISNIFAPGYLKFWIPYFGSVDVPALISEVTND